MDITTIVVVIAATLFSLMALVKIVNSLIQIALQVVTIYCAIGKVRQIESIRQQSKYEKCLHFLDIYQELDRRRLSKEKEQSNK